MGAPRPSLTGYRQEADSDAPALRICWQVLMSLVCVDPVAALQLAVENVQLAVD